MRTDDELHAEVTLVLMRDHPLEDTHLGVRVCNGRVTLCGRVDSYARAWAAHRAVQDMAGVHNVALEIQVMPSAPEPSVGARSER